MPVWKISGKKQRRRIPMIDVAFPLKGQCHHLMMAVAENASWGRTDALPVRASSVDSSWGGDRDSSSEKATRLRGGNVKEMRMEK